MPFPYTQQTWVDGSGGGTPISAARLGVIESGIALAGVIGTSSSPPGSPTDGMIWRLPADSSNGIYWWFQYDSSQATNKWVSMGGQPMISEVATSETTTSTSYVDLTTVGPSITVPRAGDYLVTFGSAMFTNTSATNAIAAVKRGAAATSDNDAIAHTSAAASHQADVSRSLRVNGLSASDVLKVQYKGDTATKTFLRRWLHVEPIRVI